MFSLCEAFNEVAFVVDRAERYLGAFPRTYLSNNKSGPAAENYSLRGSRKHPTSENTPFITLDS
jgi:hypothetical protein